MCCLFGVYDYTGGLTAVQKRRLVSALATASKARGTDATGVAYNSDGHLAVYKRPWPAHLMRFRLPENVRCVMGHTRMTTQGDEKKNCNNHPFVGAAGIPFALAHNGILYNDKELRQERKLPETNIETDSYIAVQLLEQQGKLSFSTIRTAADLGWSGQPLYRQGQQSADVIPLPAAGAVHLRQHGSDLAKGSQEGPAPCRAPGGGGDERGEYPAHRPAWPLYRGAV